MCKRDLLLWPAVLAIGLGLGLAAVALAQPSTGGVMQISSPAFEPAGTIPARHTCDGAGTSPPLRWSAIPSGTRSLALVVDDPDAPRGTWVHWVYYDIPARLGGLPEAVAPAERPAPGGVQGITDFRRLGYGGPCPPSGTHRYFFKLYALDAVLHLDPGVNKEGLLAAMAGHILARAELMGRYRRR